MVNYIITMATRLLGTLFLTKRNRVMNILVIRYATLLRSEHNFHAFFTTFNDCLKKGYRHVVIQGRIVGLQGNWCNICIKSFEETILLRKE